MFIRGCCGSVVTVGSDGDVEVGYDAWMLSLEVLVIMLFNEEGSDPVPSNEGTDHLRNPVLDSSHPFVQVMVCLLPCI